MKNIEMESVHTVSEGDELQAILRRDPISKKHLVYLVQEATCADIAELMKGKKIKVNEE